MRIDKIIPEKTAVLVIDMQNDFVGPGAPIYIDMGHQMAPALKEFLRSEERRVGKECGS